MLSQQRNKKLPGQASIAGAQTTPPTPINDPLTEQGKKAILEFVVMYGDAINDASAMRIGPSGWFKSYLKSKEFNELSDDLKDQAFTIYENLKCLFDSLDDLLKDYQLSIYEPEDLRQLRIANKNWIMH